MSESDGIVHHALQPGPADELLIAAWSFESASLVVQPPGYFPHDGYDEIRLERDNPLLRFILPDAATCIILCFADRCSLGLPGGSLRRAPAHCVIGPHAKAIRLRLGRMVKAIGVVFDATATSAVLGTQASDLVDSVTALPTSWRKRVSALAAAARDLELRTVAAQLREVVREAIASSGDDRLMTVARAIRRSAGNASVADLAAQARVSRQYLSRQLRSRTGFSTKEYIRLVRFHALLESTFHRGPSAWQDAAAELGLSDQAHLIREFKSFAGKAPRRFVAEGP